MKLLLCGLLLSATACAMRAKTVTGARAFSVYPNWGFGRAGCFAGHELVWRQATSPDAASAAKTGPWLVLDSISRSEYVTAYPESNPKPTELLRAIMIHQGADTLQGGGGSWNRVGPDSIVVQNNSTFPSQSWRFALTKTGLDGVGTIVSDLRVHTSAGRDSNIIMTQKAHIFRIACSQVPKRPPGWPWAH